MTHRVSLLAPSPSAWVDCVAGDFDAFLLDHASAERKASAMAVSFVVQYPDKYALHAPLIRLAREELLHYQQVMGLIHKRKLIWERDEKDGYVRALLQHLSVDRRLRLLDRLMAGAVIEARGVERFGLVAERVEEPALKAFYARLSKSEANHAALFPRLARKYFDKDEVTRRLDHWLRLEAEALSGLPIRAALH